MATRKPLVFLNGEVEGMSPGDTIDPSYLPSFTPGSINNGTALLDAGSTPQDEISVVVLTANVLSTSVILLAPNPVGTVDHDEDEHSYEDYKLRYTNIVPGVSFRIRMICKHRFGLLGQWSIRWSILG